MRITQDGELNTDGNVDALIIAILRKDQKDKCLCGVSLSEGFQIAHKRYGIDITLKDIVLSCGPCHAMEHGFKSYTGTLRK